MSNQIWFVSDTHFAHQSRIDPDRSVLKFSNRPFNSIEEHDETLIENWNRIVRNGDDVYHVGDFSFGNKETASKVRERLPGNIHIIWGNHDRAAKQICKRFQWGKDLHSIEIGEQEIVLCHWAMRTWNKSHYGAWHCYGHSHGGLPDDPNALSMDVGVDATAMRLSRIALGQTCPPGVTRPYDYRPINFDEVTLFMRAKAFKPIDHHI